MPLARNAELGRSALLMRNKTTFIIINLESKLRVCVAFNLCSATVLGDTNQNIKIERVSCTLKWLLGRSIA
jgi:hypothetical protein